MIGGGAGLLVLTLDVLTKFIVKGTLAVTGQSVPVLPGVLSFRYVENVGAAFSMGEGFGTLFALLACAVTIGIAVYLRKAPEVSKLEVLGLGLMAGGAIGNAIDRVALGFVVDFIATDFIDFPVFNVADIGITVGVALAFIGFMFLSPAAKKGSE
ncbi:MAG: signal peptidase II [Coriobacteriaceae bacterium]|nr:signal peptidase II [Coriobacteriaceae bacterium]